VLPISIPVFPSVTGLLTTNKSDGSHSNDMGEGKSL
jgi:hypothetical protein